MKIKKKNKKGDEKMSQSSQQTSPTTDYELFLSMFGQHFNDDDVQLIRQLYTIYEIQAN